MQKISQPTSWHITGWIKLIIAKINYVDVKSKLAFLGFLSAGAMPAFGYAASIILLLASLPFFSLTVLKKNMIFTVLMSQYFLVQLLFSYFHNGELFLDGRDQKYLIMLVAILPIICLASHGRDHTKQVLTGLQTGLGLAIVFLGWEYFKNTCRTSGLVFNPLGTGGLLLLIGFAVASFWSMLSIGQRYVTGTILTFCIVAVIGFTGSRMAFYSLTLFLMLTALILLLKKSRMDIIKHISIVFFMAITLTYLFDMIKPCGFVGRVSETFRNIFVLAAHAEEAPLAPARELQEPQWNTDANLSQDIFDAGISRSEGERLAQWVAALEVIPKAWVFGYGVLNERAVLEPISGNAQPHAHNQYLSWLLNGGIFGLISGLLMYLSIAIATENRALALLVIGPFIASQLTDSLIFASEMLVLIPLAIIIVYAAMAKQCKV